MNLCSPVSRNPTSRAFRGASFNLVPRLSLSPSENSQELCECGRLEGSGRFGVQRSDSLRSERLRRERRSWPTSSNERRGWGEGKFKLNTRSSTLHAKEPAQDCRCDSCRWLAESDDLLASVVDEFAGYSGGHPARGVAAREVRGGPSDKPNSPEQRSVEFADLIGAPEVADSDHGRFCRKVGSEGDVKDGKSLLEIVVELDEKL